MSAKTIATLATGLAVTPSDLVIAPTPPANGDCSPNCPECHGVGYVRYELPLGHPKFGKLERCSTRHRVPPSAFFEELCRLLLGLYILAHPDGAEAQDGLTWKQDPVAQPVEGQKFTVLGVARRVPAGVSVLRLRILSG